jgi:hypothetical protein
VALTAIRHLKGSGFWVKGNSRTVNYEPPFLLSGAQNSRAFAEIAVVRDRGNANAHYQYGVALLHENKPYLALGELKEAIEINPSHVEAKRAAVSAISAVEGSLSEDRKRFVEYLDDEYCHPVLNDALPSGAADIQRPHRKAANSETTARENTPRAVADIYRRPLRSIARYTSRLMHNLRGGN